MESVRLAAAAAFCQAAHAGQVRKYDNKPYSEHPLRVGQRIANLSWATCSMIVAAYLHDVVEDTAVSLDEIRRVFGIEVAELVDELTDKYTKATCPLLNRAARKAREAKRLGGCSREAKAIKLADVADNLRDMEPSDPFAKVFLGEKLYIMTEIGNVDDDLHKAVEEAATNLARRVEEFEQHKAAGLSRHGKEKS